MTGMTPRTLLRLIALGQMLPAAVLWRHDTGIAVLFAVIAAVLWYAARTLPGPLPKPKINSKPRRNPR